MIRSLFLCVAIAALCAACSSPNPPPRPAPPAALKAPPQGGAASPPPAGPMRSVDGKLGGSAGCNNFNAGYRAEGSALRIEAPPALAVSARLAPP